MIACIAMIACSESLSVTANDGFERWMRQARPLHSQSMTAC